MGLDLLISRFIGTSSIDRFLAIVQLLFFTQATLKVRGESYRQERKLRKSELSLCIVFYFCRYIIANDTDNEKNHGNFGCGVVSVAGMVRHVRKVSSLLNICPYLLLYDAQKRKPYM